MAQLRLVRDRDETIIVSFRGHIASSLSEMEVLQASRFIIRVATAQNVNGFHTNVTKT
jgi:hypothetical protein